MLIWESYTHIDVKDVRVIVFPLFVTLFFLFFFLFALLFLFLDCFDYSFLQFKFTASRKADNEKDIPIKRENEKKNIPSNKKGLGIRMMAVPLSRFLLVCCFSS